MQKRVAVILCGSGFKDGSEIRESVALLWALETEKAEISLFALNEPQHEVVNCLTGQPTQGSRNQLVEAARIARGKISPLEELKTENFDCLILPGGFGAAKNLCDFAFKGENMTNHPLLEKLIKKFHEDHKPIGAICIAPIIVAKALQGVIVHMTLGLGGVEGKIIEKWGHQHIEKKAHECNVDRWSKVVTTPAYMDDSAQLPDIFKGIHSLVKECLALI